MVNQFLTNLITKKNNMSIAYAHNAARYDTPILLKYINNNPKYKTKITYANTTIYKLQITDKETGYKISIQDSFHILPHPLKTLGLAFQVETPKGEFPHTFASDEKLEYIGQSPCGHMAD